jgi:hypothetical protein
LIGAVGEATKFCRVIARAKAGGAAGAGRATGLPAVNDRLSGLRADYIKDRLESEQGSLRGRLVATGKGSREMIVGTGRDDASDSLDRRVELKVMQCGGSST